MSEIRVKENESLESALRRFKRGCINLLVEMNSLKSGMEALGRITKGHEIIL